MSNRSSVALAAWLMERSKDYPPVEPLDVFFTKRFVEAINEGLSPASQYEFGMAPTFYRLFGRALRELDLRGADVLDLACAYGGKTAYNAQVGRVKSIVGVETSERKVRIATASAQVLAPDAPVEFRIGRAEDLPFADGSFDYILADGAFEHVQDLPAALSQCFRVLRPGGKVYALFPPYYGPLAHHLCFVTNIPFLHVIFAPDTIVSAVNRVLERNPSIGVNPFPDAMTSYHGRRVIPRLNGTTEKDFRQILQSSAFHVEDISLIPFAWSPGGMGKRMVHAVCRAMIQVPWPFTRDAFTSLIRCILAKPR